MRKSLLLTTGLWIAILALLPLAAPALDWPQWFGPDRDGISKETGLLKSWPKEGPKLLWQAQLDQGFSSMAVVGDRLYTQYQRDDAQWVGAFDVATGREVWKIRTGDKVHTGPDFPGPRSTPLYEDGKLYVLDGHGNLYCLDVAARKPVWQINVLEKFGGKNLQWNLSMSPVIDGNLLLVTPGISDDSAFVALDKKTGNVAWKAFDPATKKGLGERAGYCSPVVATLGGVRQYVFFPGTSLLGVNAKDGALLWRFPWKTSYDLNAAIPIIQDDKIFITSGYNHGCALLRIKPGAPQTVEKIWESKVMRSQVTSPILHKGYVYGYDDQAVVCVELETGTGKWKDDGFKQGTLTMADGLLYILGQNGNLALVRPTPEKCDRISEFQTPLKGLPVPDVHAPVCWVVPVIANGRLYVRDEALMLCYDVSAATPAESK